MTRFPVTFISSYAGVSDYGVYVRRLGRDVRVHRQQGTDEIQCRCSELSDEEKANAVESVREHLAAEHAEFLAWAERKGFAVEAGR